MKNIFLGKPIHWLLWAVVQPVLWAMGKNKLHTIDFHAFIPILVALSTACVPVIVLPYRQGDRTTREPFDEQ